MIQSPLMGYACLDTETTGLTPWPHHEPWGVALILPATPGCRVDIIWQLPVDLGRADPKALAVNDLHNRRWAPAHSDEQRRRAIAGVGGQGPGFVVHPDDMHLWAAEFARLVRGRSLVGANVAFDQKDHLDGLLRRHGACPEYHYRPVDIEAALWGYLHGLIAGEPALAEKLPEGTLDLPWSHDRLLDAVEAVTGVDLGRGALARHTALDDTLLVGRVHALIAGPA